MEPKYIYTYIHCYKNLFSSQLNSDEFLNVDLILEEIMHTLILGPLTVHLREALRKHLNNISEESTTTAK